MSWMKRGQQGAGTQPYAAVSQAQPFGNQQNMYPNYQGGNGSAPSQPQQPQQQFWQHPPQQSPQQTPQQPPQQQFNHSQHYGQPYSQDYPPNTNQFQQPTHQYNQNYANQYANPQQNYQQHYYQTQPAQQTYPQNAVTGNADGWEDNWDWGWEENAKKVQSLQNTTQKPPVQQQVFNNANVIEESFASTDSWNWAMDEKKENKVLAPMPPPRQDNNEPATLPTQPVQNNVVPEPTQNNILNQQTEEVKTLSDREVIKERLPNLALGKRFHIENLTPQWSIESQMSQESSDGPHTQSEGTYRSENQSRNSGESPGPNMDNSNFTYTQPGFNETYIQNSEWPKNSDEPTMADDAGHNRRESEEELSNSLQEMSIGEQHSTNTTLSVPRNAQENVSTQPAPTLSPSNLPAPAIGGSPVPLSSMPPPPAVSSAAPQLPPPASLAPLVPRPLASSSASLPPALPPSNSQNPFQRAGPISHKSTTKPPVPAQLFQPQLSNCNLASPAVVNKVAQGRAPVGFEANLESTPDNSERPDQPPAPFRAQPAPALPDNLEVAPQNDRNEYLQTAHLSSGHYGENTDFTRNLPPPGLRRMVVGQQESEYQNLNISGDEPPPGLSRMVPGQQTEGENAYMQPSDNYMERHVDGQLMDSAGSTRPFRQADGQQNSDTYSQPATGRAGDRRPVGFDRMVPGERSNDEYPQYQAASYATNEHRVVTGVDRDFEATASDVREQNMDGSDYTEPAPRTVLGARELSNDMTLAAHDETQREVTMEGENLQDLSVISSVDLTYSREHLEGADQNVTDGGTDRNDASDSLDRPATDSRKQSLNRVHSSGEESERDMAFKSSPRRDRHKTSRDRDRNRERDKEGRYSRGDRSDRKYERDDRRREDKRTDKTDRDRRDRERAREGDASPDARRHRRSTRSRKHDDTDTDYYSDRERERRRYREGSYTSKPPRPEGDRRGRYDDRRYNTVERERRDRDRPRDSTRRDRDRYERHYADYRDIDPSRKYGNLHREREEERRRGDTLSSASRPESREAAASATDEEAGARRGLARRRPRQLRPDPYYDGYGGGGGGGGGYQDPYLAQRQQYEYYEHLRVTDPAAYMQLYNQLMAGRAPLHAPYAPREGYPSLGHEGQERGSVHSGRSSTTGLKGNDTELNTDASLGLQLDASTVRSERMTPFRFSTAHVKAALGGGGLVLVPAAYPAAGRPARVHVLSLAAVDPAAAALAQAPGPLVKGVTHKKSVIEYCMVRVRSAARETARDVTGYVLLWELLALMLRQNGVVVGTDIAELLLKNSREYPGEGGGAGGGGSGGAARAGSSLSESPRDAPATPEPSPHDYSLSETLGDESLGSPCVDEKAALDKYREYLLYGNRHEALEWAMSNNLWGHALQLAGSADRRVRSGVAQRFLRTVPRADPLHTLYATRHAAHAHPPACAGAGAGAEWRGHVGMLLANASARPDLDARALQAIGDSLSSRGLPHSAQFCYVVSGEPFSRHPLAPLCAPPAPAAPPRLSLLLAAPRAPALAELASARAILATEIYEYARSLSGDYVIPELQVYKLIAACRLLDAGQHERALAYVEAAARAVTRDPRPYSRALVRALAHLADRLKYHDPALSPVDGGAGAAGEEGADSAEGSPRHHQWLDDVNTLAHNLQMESASQQVTPQHHYYEQNPHQHQHQPAPAWGDTSQAQQYQQTPNQTYTEPEDTAEYSPYYSPLPAPLPAADPPAPPDQPGAYTGAVDPPGPPAPAPADQYPPPAPAQEDSQYHYEDWTRTEETHSQSYGDPYWQGDNYSYGEGAAGDAAAGGGGARPAITMPGAAAAARSYEYDDDDTPATEARARAQTGERARAAADKAKEGKADGGGRSWIGGILTKLSLRPPNQMILPDDKNPTIVWDADKKRWRNTDGTEEEVERPPPPPPSHHVPSASPPPAGAAPGANIFKMQKGRHIKKSYVDVFNPAGAAPRPPPLAAGPAPAPLAPTDYFVPPPAAAAHAAGPYEADGDLYPRSGI